MNVDPRKNICDAQSVITLRKKDVSPQGLFAEAISGFTARGLEASASTETNYAIIFRPKRKNLVKNLISIAVTVTFLFALSLPVLAGDGGPLPVCPPGTNCKLRTPVSSPGNRPLCCSLLPPQMDITFGDINQQDRTLAQFPPVSPISRLAADCEGSGSAPAKSSAAAMSGFGSSRSQ